MTSRSKPTIHKFDILSVEFQRSPWATYDEMRNAGPVVRSRFPIVGPVWMFTDHDACSEMLKNQELFARDPKRAGKKFVAGFLRFMPRGVKALTNNLMSYDGEDHFRLRSLVEQAFRRQSVEEMRPRLRALAEQFIDLFEQSADRQHVVDLHASFSRPYPLEVISELLGLPDEDRPNFSRLGKRLSSVRSLWSMLGASTSLWGIRNYLKHQIEKSRKSPRPGLLSAMIQAEQDGDKMTADELLSMTFLLLLAGHETTSQLLTTTIATLLQFPEQKDKLVANWQLARGAVEESLRYVSPIQISKPRMVTKDVVVHGQQLRRGDYTIAMIGPANHDPAKFCHPEQFDITRDPNPHLSFGAGIHTCLGLKLARAETEVALESIFTRFPDLQLPDPETPPPWSRRLGMRTFDALPVCLSRSGSR